MTERTYRHSPPLRSDYQPLDDNPPEEVFQRDETRPDSDSTVPPAAPFSLLPSDSASRKEFPLKTGLWDYFPAALVQVAHMSWCGNQKHNPGQPLHHARGKSMDHEDCIERHGVQLGGFEEISWNDANGVKQTRHIRHSVARAWRALAAAQAEIEREEGAPLPPGARE